MEKFCLGRSWELKGKCYINLDKIWKEEKYPKHTTAHLLKTQIWFNMRH